jgi:uncharacterized protein YndB with AHSA1/START domain
MPSVTSRVIKAPPESVWRVLSDGWLYGLWVVGASRIRTVDEEWPSVGSRIEHSVGCWPVLIDDATSVTSLQPDQEIGLRARAWPGGEAAVTITLEPIGRSCRVTITEDASRGPGKLIPGPLRRTALHWRNEESLRRLAYLAERRDQD